ncbi:MAG: sugar ABC transporter substrate-binding protein [Rhizobiaceae bacterium]|nr:sugar ABC transporter substrate-binding protein [Rhizobiaceae bacterium]
MSRQYLPAQAARVSSLRHLVAALAVATAAITAASAAKAEDAKLTVCTIVPTTEIEYFATLLNEYQKSGASRGIEVITIDSQNNPAREASSIEDCIAKKVNAIVASVIDPATSKASAEAAMKAGIPFILQGQEPEDVDWATGNVGYSEADMGKHAGEEVAACLKIKQPDAETIKVGACGWPQWPSTVRRIEASKAAVEKETGKKIEWVFEQECGTREKGDQAVSAALQSNPDLRAVVSINDGSSMGALAAFEAAGISPDELCIAAPNNDLEVRQYIESGKIYGTVDLNHSGIAEKAMDLVMEVSKGNSIPKMTYVDMIKVTKDNVGQWPTK